MFASNPFYMKIEGPYALFTDPLSKGIGEKVSYLVPTMQALKGIVEAVYWKPTLYYLIDEVKVLKPIQTETKSVLLPMNNGKKDLSHFTYLRDVSYAIKFHFEWAEGRPQLEQDRNEKKHEQILLRSMKRGGRRDIFLGTRECIGAVTRLREKEYDALTPPFTGKLSLGIMFHSFSYQETNKNKKGEGELYSQFDSIVMENGVIRFKRPEDCPIHHMLTNYKIHSFSKDSVRTVDEEWEAYNQEGGMAHESVSGSAQHV
ncbi:MAG: type I-C CRISPR-associated protein Cas5c [Acidaminococcus sp.]|nr:type I-C CRISPR-associated protein Cas5c [Acidaminococcus sp.]MCI2100914.1 type I-C CRISPR-associated protein Cas5c [Acidaminococcus sp.]